MKERHSLGRDEVTAFWMILPVCILTLLFVYYPAINTFIQSMKFLNLRLPGLEKFVGLTNYLRIFQWGEFWASLYRTVQVILISLPLELLVGLGGALLLNNRFRGRGLVRTVAIIPWMLPPVVNGFMWAWLLNGKYGALNGFLYQLGVIREYVTWMGTPFSQLFWVSVANAWTRFPFVMLILLAGLQSIPEELYEAAKIDGARPLAVFRHITFPLLLPAFTIALTVEFIFTFQIFDIIWSITAGGTAGTVINPFTRTVMVLNYQVVFRDMNIGLGSALAYVLMFISLAVGLFFVRRLYREGMS